MPRLASALLCSLAVAAWAAPAPLPRPWVTGWDRPIDPRRDCKFERAGDRLTITVPGAGHALDVRNGRLNAPRLLRDAEGHFTFEVRVGGTFGLAGEKGFRRAGIVVTGGDIVLTFELSAGREGGTVLVDAAHPTAAAIGFPVVEKGPPVASPAYLRLERREDRLVAQSSPDGKKWQRLRGKGSGLFVAFPEKVKVGVIAESTAPGDFRATFDQFQLSRPAK